MPSCWLVALVTGLLLAKLAFSCVKNETYNYGSVLYKTWRTEDCSWKFGPGDLKSDVIASVQFLSYRSTWSAWDSSSTTTVPDGQKISNEDLPRSLSTSSNKDWCGLYVKTNNGSETTCEPGIQLRGKCRNNPVTVRSRDWPPTMNTTMKNWQFLLVYAFFECKLYPSSTTADRTKTQTAKPSQSPISEASTTAVRTPCVANASQRVTASSNVDIHQAKQKDNATIEYLTIAAILLAVLLLAALSVIIVLVLKTRVLWIANHIGQSSVGLNAVSSTQNETYNDTQPANLDMIAASKHTMVDNEIYDSHALDDTKQTVYNELYTA